MNKKHIAFLSAALILFIACSAGFASAQETGTAAKDFTLKGLNNSSFTLSDYKGKKPVLMLFWTTWCPFCRKELKVLEGKYPQIVKDGVELAVINVSEPAAKAQNFAQKNNFPFRIFLDSNGNVAQAFGIYGIPTYFLIDKKGVIRSEDNSFPEKEYNQVVSENHG